MKQQFRKYQNTEKKTLPYSSASCAVSKRFCKDSLVSVPLPSNRFLWEKKNEEKCHCLPFNTLGQNKTKFIWIDKEQMNQLCFPFTAKKKSKLLKQLTRSSNEGGFTKTYLAFRSVCLMFLTPLISTSNTQSLPEFWINSTAILL